MTDYSKNRIPVHPGEVLLHEFVVPRKITNKDLLVYLNGGLQGVADLLSCARKLQAVEAWRLAQAFGTTPEFWANLQMHHDLAMAKPTKTVGPFKLQLSKK